MVPTTQAPAEFGRLLALFGKAADFLRNPRPKE